MHIVIGDTSERYAQVMVKSMWSDAATHDQGNDHREKPDDQSQLHPVHSTRQMSNLVPESTDLTAKLGPQSSDLSAELLLCHQLGEVMCPRCRNRW